MKIIKKEKLKFYAAKVNKETWESFEHDIDYVLEEKL